MPITNLHTYISKSISLKFIFLLGLFIFLMGALTVTYFFTKTREQLHNKLIEKGTILAENLAYNATFGGNLEDPEILGILINGVINRKDIAYVIFYDSKGKYLAFKDPLYVRKIIKPVYLPVEVSSMEPIISMNTISKGNAFYDFIVPIIIKKGVNRLPQKEIGTPTLQPVKDEVIGIVRVGVSLNSLNEDLRNILLFSILITGIIILVSIATATIFIKIVVRHIMNMATAASAIAEGDLSHTVNVSSKDEVGILGNAFIKMAGKLKDMIKSIQDISKNVVSASHDISIYSNNVSGGAQQQSQSIERISTSIDGINNSIHDVANSIDTICNEVGVTSSSVLEMETSINEVAKHTEELETSVEKASSAILEISVSIKQVADHAEILADATNKTVLTTQEINITVSKVEEIAKVAARLSEKVSEDAAKIGLQSVKKTIEGMQNIKVNMDNLAKVVSGLGARSAQIGGILTIIDEVTDQTELLALNAAILAAQSGEHGRGFAVVADAIKDMAEKTDASTKEIAQIISDVQAEVADAVTLTKEVLRSVEEGNRLSIESDGVLHKMLESAEQSKEMAKQIEQSTIEQVDSIKEVTESINKINTMIVQITNVSQEQNIGTQRIIEATERVRNIANRVRRATAEQASGSNQIVKAMSNVSAKIQEIVIASNDQTKGSQKILNSIEEIRSITQRNVEISSEMSTAVNLLARQSELLESQARKFKI